MKQLRNLNFLISIFGRHNQTANKWHFARRLILLIIVISIPIAYEASLSYSMWPYDQPSQSIKFRLRVKNESKFQFFKFIDLVQLKNLCESLTTIQCLDYLHRNQTTYLQPLSVNETRLFKEAYCTENNKILFHTFWAQTHSLNNQILQTHILSFLYTQNLQCSRLIVWLLPPLDDHIKQLYDTLYAPHVEFRSVVYVAKKLRELNIYVRFLSLY